MKSAILFFVLCLSLNICAFAQVPLGINYQSVARDGTGQILTNHTISIEFAIHDSVPGGPVIYSETQSVGTNTYGIFSTVIGAGGGVIGTFTGINWGVRGKFLQVLMDFSGGTNFVDMGTSQFMSVPYSLYSNGSIGDVTGVRYDTAGVLNIMTPGATYTGKGVWTTTGNAALSPTNFIGTTDNNDLILKSHNIEAIRYAAGGALLATGNTSTGVTPASGAGSRMMWIPAKGAFRAGTVTGAAWDNANIGANSIAMGTDVLASGPATVAIGNNNIVTGAQAAAFGKGLIVKTMGATVVGSFNDTTGSGSSTTWNASDPLFQVGNGSSAAARGNAISITKSGNITASGLLLNQGISLTPSAPITVSGTATIPVGNQGFIVLYSTSGSGGNHIILGAGQNVGQILIIEVTTNGGGHGITLDDSVLGNNMNLSGTYPLLNQGTATLMYDGSNWVEISHSSN